MSREAIKQKDVSKLIQMVSYISFFESQDGSMHNELFKRSDGSLRDTLIKIGDLSGGTVNKLGYCDKHDPESYYIRNKYGYIQRNKENEINVDGIFFEKLYHLKIVLEQKSTDLAARIAEDFQKKTKELTEYLPFLKSKFLFILDSEKDFIEDQYKGVLSLRGMGVGLAQLPPKNALVEFSTIHYDQCIFNKILDEVSVLKTIETETNYFDSKDLRYSLARAFTVIGELSREYVEGKGWANTDPHKPFFDKLRKARDQLVHNHKKIAHGAIDDDEKAKITTAVHKMLEHLEKMVKVESATGKFEIDYKCNFKNATESVKAFFKALEGKSYSGDSSTIPEQQALKTPSVPKMKDIKTFIMTANSIIKQGKPVSGHLNREYIALFADLDVSERANYPTDLMHPDNLNLIAKFASEIQKQPSVAKASPSTVSSSTLNHPEKDTVLGKLEGIRQEVEYLTQIESVDEHVLPLLLKDHVIQHTMTIIGQHVEDLEKHDASRQVATLSSVTGTAASFVAKRARVEGLAHNPLDFDMSDLRAKVREEIIPAHEDFESVLLIYKYHKGKVPISAIVLNKIGIALLRTGCYEDAIGFFTQAANHLETHGEEIKKAKILSMGGSQETAKSARDANFIDLGEHLFGIDEYEFTITVNLSKAHMISHNYKVAYVILKSLMSKIDLEEVSRWTSDDFKMSVAQSFGDMASCLMAAEKYAKALKLYEFANKVYIVSEMQVNMANCYSYLRRDADSAKLLQKLVSSPDVWVKIHALSGYVQLLLKELRIDEATTYITQIESTLSDNMSTIKQQHGDRCFLVDLLSKSCRLELISKKCEIEPQNFIALNNELKDQVGSIELLIGCLKADLKSDIKVGNAYLLLSKAFAAQIVEGQQEISKSNLESAKHYFNKIQNDTSVHFTPNLLGIAAFTIAIGLNNYAEWYLEDNIPNQIELLRQALEIQLKYEICTDVTLLNLGLSFHNLAECYFGGKNEIAQSNHTACEHYESSVEYLQKIQIDDVQSRTKLAILKVLAMSFEGIGDCGIDTCANFQKALDYYQLAIDMQSDTELVQYKRECQAKLAKLETREVFVDPVISTNPAFDVIEQKMKQSFDGYKSKKHKNPANVTMSISSDKYKDVVEYCKSVLKLADDNLEYEGGQCIIELNEYAVEYIGNLA